jgi:hypothetical protein
MYSSDTSLAEYLEDNFYSFKEPDTCYTGIHFIEVEFSNKNSLMITVTGELKNQYGVRIRQLLQKFRHSFFNSKFVNYCRKNKKIIIQPIFFDITDNCFFYDTTLHFKNPDVILQDTTGREIPKLLSSILMNQKLSLIDSFKKIENRDLTNCIILEPCIIQGRKIKNKSFAYW